MNEHLKIYEKTKEQWENEDFVEQIRKVANKLYGFPDGKTHWLFIIEKMQEEHELSEQLKPKIIIN